MAGKKRFQGGGYAALFFVLFFIIWRSLESLIFTAQQQASHMQISTFVVVLLAIVSWYLGRKVAESKEGKK